MRENKVKIGFCSEDALSGRGENAGGWVGRS